MILALGCAVPGLALAQAVPSVVSIYPLRSVQTGARSVELGFEVDGAASQVAVSLKGTSTTQGVFVDLARVMVSRDQAGAVPFHVLVPLSRAFPADGRLEVSATPVGDEGAQVARVQVVLDATLPPPAFAPNPVSARASVDTGQLLVDVAFQGSVARAELTVMGASAALLRTVKGDLAEVESHAFAVGRRLVAHPRVAAPGHVAFAVPVQGGRIPPDGVVVADVALVDAFGRTVHTSTVEFTDSAAFDPVLDLRVGPSPLLLSEGFGQRVPLQVTAVFAIAGEVDVSGGAHGVTYASDDPSVATVTRDGQVVARATGGAQETVVRVQYAGVTRQVPVLVDSSASLVSLEIVPALPATSPTIERVGGSLQLKLVGTLSNQRQVDLTQASLGTQWRSEDPTRLLVSADGRVTSRQAQPARVFAKFPDQPEVSLSVDAQDAFPTLRLSAPASVVAGGDLEVTALATDDVGLARVEFRVNGVPTVTDTTAPFTLQVKAPPTAGATLVLSAWGVDTANQGVLSSELRIPVTGAPAPSSRTVVYEAPEAGQVLIAGLPQTVRVTSGDWKTATLSPNDFQSVRFSVDGAPLGAASAPRVEVRSKPTDKGTQQVLVPVWEVSFIPPLTAAGTGVVLRAEAVDGVGAQVPVQSLAVRVAADSAPLITLKKPDHSPVDVTAGAPFAVSGAVADDALAFGVDVKLLVQGAVVASQRLTKSSFEGSPSGSAEFSFHWTPPASLLGADVKVEVQAIDVGGNPRVVTFQAKVKADQPPQLNIVSPGVSDPILAGSRMLLAADVSDDSPPPVRVTWYVDGVLAGLSSAAPYSAEVLVPAQAVGRTLIIKAVARDSTGMETTATRNVIASPDLLPPSVSIVSPLTNASVVTTQDLLVTAAGLDDVGVKKVEFFLNGALTPVFTDTAPARNGTTVGSFLTHFILPKASIATLGSHRLRVHATDAAGNVGISPEVLFQSKQDAPPTVAFTRPLVGASATLGTVLEVLVTATDDVSVQGVELFLGNTHLTALTAPYRFEVPLSGTARTETLRVVATDSGGTTAEATRTVALVEDDQAPLVGFRLPAEGARVFAGRTMNVEVVASDNVGVAWVDLYRGTQRVARLTEGQEQGLYRVFTFQVPTVVADVGQDVTLRAVASDLGTQDVPSRTAERTLKVRLVQDLPPSVTVLAPPPGSPYKEGEDVRLTVSLTDDDGVIGWVGVSGDVRQGLLPTTGAARDVAQPQSLVVRAPLVHLGQPATVGVIARDTAMQDSLPATVTLAVTPDVQKPRVSLVSPQVGAAGAVDVVPGGSLGVRVDVRDDVRVSSVVVLLDGQALSPPVVLPNTEEHFDEVRTPDPLGPGTVLLGREYVGTYAGTVALPALSAGPHTLTVQASDPAGNTSSAEVALDVKPKVDREAPRLTLVLRNTPDDATCVAGSTVELGLQASDDGQVQTLELFLDGVPWVLPAITPGASVSATVNITLPALVSGPRPITFFARAVDATGKTTEQVLTRLLTSDAPPTVSWVAPTAGAALTEERAERLQVELKDDVKVESAFGVLATAEATPVEGAPEAFDVVAPGATGAGLASQVTWSLGEGRTSQLDVASGRVRVVPPAAGLGNQPGRAKLKVAAPPLGQSVKALVGYRYRLNAGAETVAEVKAFLATLSSGRREVEFKGPSYEVDLGFPSAFMTVDEIDVELTSAGTPVDVSRTQLVYDGNSVQVRAVAAGAWLAVARWGVGGSGPGRALQPQVLLRPSLGWSPRAAVLTAFAGDGQGHRVRSSRPVRVRPDLDAPVATVLQPTSGGGVVAGVPVSVVLSFQDNVEVESADLLVDGAARESFTRPGTSAQRTLVLQPGATGAPVALTVVARDRAGNASVSSPTFVHVRADTAPSVRWVKLQSAVETASETELASGLVRLVQGTPATLTLEVLDDVGVALIQTAFGDAPVSSRTVAPAQAKVSHEVEFTPPVSWDGAPSVLSVTVTDTAGKVGTARLVVEGRAPLAPVLALSVPRQDATLTEGSIQLFVQALAGDDTGVARVEFFLNGQRALEVLGHQGAAIPVLQDGLVDDLPVPVDTSVRAAFQALVGADADTPYRDISRLKTYGGRVLLPPGFLALDASRSETRVAVRVVATDREGHVSVVERSIVVVADDKPPAVKVLLPTLSQAVVEKTSFRVSATAWDNVFVDQVRLFSGPGLDALQLFHTAGGFPLTNAFPNSEVDVYAPLVNAQAVAPALPAMGAADMDYFVVAEARDLSGKQARFIQPIRVVRDREPAVAIVSPPDGRTVVEGSLVPVTVAAEDDVSIASVQLTVNDVPLTPVLRQPPFTFQVPVPQGAQQLTLQAKAVDSYGHATSSQVVLLPVGQDKPPTIAVAQPQDGVTLTEGRDFGLVLAAQDDVALAWVEAVVEGGVNGPLRYTATTKPFSFRVPLPYGSAHRRLIVRARARDSLGHESSAPVVTLPVQADAQPPTVKFLTPANNSQIVAGMNLDLEAVADDNVAVAAVVFSLQGSPTPLATLPAPPYRFTYRALKSDVDKSLTFVARAVDASGLTAQVQAQVTVVNAPPLAVALQGPASVVAGLPATFSAQVSQASLGVAHVSLHMGPEASATEVSRRYLLPYDFAYEVPKAQVGQTLHLRAQVRDVAGREAWSPPLDVLVKQDEKPTVAIRKPLAGSNVFDGGRIRIEAKAQDVDSGLQKVIFLVDGKRVDVAEVPAGIPGAPDVYVGTFVAPVGSRNRRFSLTAVAVDLAGQEQESAPVDVGTVSDTVPPDVEWVEPLEFDVVTGGSLVALKAAARDNVQVQEVEFFADGVSAGSTGESVPGPAGRPLYSRTRLLPNDRAGQLVPLRATAKDPSDNNGKSQVVTVELGLQPSPARLTPFNSGRLGPLAVSDTGRVAVGGVGLSSTEVPQGNALVFAQLSAGDQDIQGLGSVPFAAPPAAVAFHGAQVLVLTPSRTLQAQFIPPLLSVVDPTTQAVIGSVDLPGDDVLGVAVKDRLAYVANGRPGVVVVDLSDPKLPQRVRTVPVGDDGARGVFVSGNLLLVASGSGGLRLLDLRNPKLPLVSAEHGFVAVPGSANAVSAVGSRAFVACEGSGAYLAEVDFSRPDAPRLVSLLSHAPARKDLRAQGLRSVSASGNLVLATSALTDQDARPVKGMLSVSTFPPQGMGQTRVRANLPRASQVVGAASGAVTVMDRELVRFGLQRMVVTSVTPEDGARQVPVAADAVTLDVFLSEVVAPGSLDVGTVVLRSGDPVVGPAVPVTVVPTDRRLRVRPNQALSRATEYFLTVGPELASEQGWTLGTAFRTRFTTRAASAELPQLTDVLPPAGPQEGGTRVTLLGSNLLPGARVFFSGAEASEVTVLADGHSLTAKVPPSGEEGAATVTVVNPNGLEASLFGGFIYLKVLHVDFVSPATGPLVGGNTVEVSGAGFQRGVTVKVGGAAASDVRVLSPGLLTLKVPAGAFGPADVVVTNPDLKSVVVPGAYLYTDLSVSSSISRHVPNGSDPRPTEKLPSLPPIKVALSENKAWVLSPSQVYVSAKDAAQMLEKSVHGALSLVDVSDPTNASLIGLAGIPPPYEPVALSVRAPYAYVVANGATLPFADVAGEGVASLLVFNAANPLAPRLLSTLPSVGEARGLALAGDLALMAAGSGGVALYSLLEPQRPVLLGAVTQFLFGGQLLSPSIEDVQVSGHFAVLTAKSGAAQRLLVVDLTKQGLPVVGELSGDATDVALAGRNGLRVTGEALRTLSLAQPARPREASPVVPLVRGMRFTSTAMGPHLGAAAAWGPSALVQLVMASEPSQPRSVNAVDLYPARKLSDVALAGGLLVATIQETAGRVGQPVAQDALSVVAMPFPVVTGSTPVDGADAVLVADPLTVSLSRPVSNASAATVKLVLMNGSTDGETLSTMLEGVATTTVTVRPTASLLPGRTYQLRVEGLLASADSAPMPGRYVAEFTTVAQAGEVPLSVTSLSPRQGPTGGGTDVWLEGSGFQSDMIVNFNGQQVPVEEVLDGGKKARVKTPNRPAGAATVTLRRLGGSHVELMGAYLYVDALDLLAVTPARGPTSGGTRVLLQGRGFALQGAVQVRFGGQPAYDVRVLGMGTVEAFTPHGLRGPVDVTVRQPDPVNPGGFLEDTLVKGYTFDQPTGSAVALARALRDVVVVGDWAFAVGDHSLDVIDLSGLHLAGDNMGASIPFDQRGGLVDEDDDNKDDRVVAHLALPDEATSVAYVPGVGGGRDLLYVGLVSRDEEGAAHGGAVAVVDVEDPTKVTLVRQVRAGAHGVFGVDVRGERLMAAAAASGLHSFDVSVEPFPVHTANVNPGAQAVVAWGGNAVVGTGTRTNDFKVGPGSLQVWDVQATPTVAGTLPDALAVQRLRMLGDVAVVAAGEDGLVLVDVSQPVPVWLGAVEVKGFAWDVRLAGRLAYVAAGAAGVAVVDLNDVLNPKLLYHVTGNQGGDARVVATAGGRLVSARERGVLGWSLEFGDAAELSVSSASVAEAEVVPTDLSSVTVFFSAAIDANTAPSAFSLTANGVPVAGLPLEVGTPDAQRSTLVFRPSAPLPAGAALKLVVTQALRTPGGAPLIAPFTVSFRAADGSGGRPVVSQVVPRVGPTSGGSRVEVLGSGFEPGVTVRVGGQVAEVLEWSPTRLRVKTPSGGVGLADVEVVQLSGLSARRPGGFLYVAPLQVGTATPRFLNPRGGSTVRVSGNGFLPGWADALGSTKVWVRGLPAASVSVTSFHELTAVAPPGSFGAADVMVVSPDGLSRVRSTSEVGYGLAFSGEESVVSASPHALVANPQNPFQVFAAAGASGRGNTFPQDYNGALTGHGKIPESYRALVFDASQPGRPLASGSQIVDPPDALVDRFFATRMGLLGQVDPPDVEVMPDSLDVAVRGGQLLVANGQSGLVVLDATQTQGLTLLGQAPLGADTGESPPLATRVLPTPTGAWLLGTSLRMAPKEQCPGRPKALGTEGKVVLFDTRVPSDPVRIGELAVGEDVFGATFARGRAFVVTGTHEGVFNCSTGAGDPFALPPPPESSLVGHAAGDQAVPGPGSTPHGALHVFASAKPGALSKTLAVDSALTDVVVVGEVAIVAAADQGLLFIDVSDPANPVLKKTLSFNEEMSNVPGHPQRLRLLGDMLFVAAAEGGVVLVDVADPLQPKLVSGGNEEPALDVVAVEDRLLLAGRDRLTELKVPFLYVTGMEPARESLVPPEAVALEVRFNRPLAAPSFTDSSVRLQLRPGAEGAPGDTVEATLEVSDATLTVRPDEALLPDRDYLLVVDASVTDQRGGGLLIPFQLAFHTASTGSQTPKLFAVTPSSASLSGGTTLTVTGERFTGTSAVYVGGQPATFTVLDEGHLTVVAPAQSGAGPVDLEVRNEGGPVAVLPSSVLYLKSLEGIGVSLFPDHGPVGGGTTVSVSLSGQALAPGTKVRVASNPHTVDPTQDLGVDVRDLSSLHFTTPAVDHPSVVPVWLVRPGEAPVQVGFFSYDLPVGTEMDLPGFPPRVASELSLRGDRLAVGVSNSGFWGLELFDVKVEEHPLRLGGVATPAAVRGVDLSGSLAFLAADAFGLLAVDVSRPEAPFLAASASTSGALATSVRVEGDRIYVGVTEPGAAWGGIQVFHAGGPRLEQVETVSPNADVLALELGADRFYALTSTVTANKGNGLWLSLYTRSGAPLGQVSVLAGERTYEQLVASRLLVRSGRAYVTVGTKLYVFDLSNEAAPRVLQSSDLGSPVAGLTFVGGSLFAATAGSSTVIEVPPTDLLAVDLTPAAGSIVPGNTVIQARFSLPVAPATVTPDTFQVSVNEGSGWSDVAGVRDLVFDTRGSTLVFSPAVPFPPLAQVRVSVTTGVKGFDTRPLAAPVQGLFTIAGPDALQPVITRVEPASGRTNVTTVVTLKGAGFRQSHQGGPGTRVRVGGQEAVVVWHSESELEVAVPPSLAALSGPALVEVMDRSSGLLAQRLGGFLYRDPLQLAALSPSQAPQQGGVTVALTGHGFQPGMTVTFGDTTAFDVHVSSMERAEVKAPPHASGLVDVTLGLSDQPSSLPVPFLYGAGAVSRLPTPPVAHVLVDEGVAYVALGGATALTNADGSVVYEASRATAQGGLIIARLNELPTLHVEKELTFTATGGARRLAKSGSWLYMAAGPAGVKRWDVSLVAAPEEKPALAATGDASDVLVKDDLLFVADGAGVSMYRLGETAAPLPVGQRPLPGGARAMVLYGSLLVVADGNAANPRLHVLDAAKGTLAEVGEGFPLSVPARHLAVSGTRVFASLGTARQVQVVELADPSHPAAGGVLTLTDPLGRTWMSAEQTWVAGGVAYVSGGGGKVQRFAVPVGGLPVALERLQVVGDARTVAFAGDYLLVGTLFLDAQGTPLELPLTQPPAPAYMLAGALSAVELDHLEILGTTPSEGDTVAVGTAPRVHVTALPDVNTAQGVTLSQLTPGGSVAVAVARRVAATTRGADVVLEPYAPLSASAQYRLHVGATLADLAGGELGTDVDVRFTTASQVSAERPVLSSVFPAHGLEAGGNRVTLAGEHFVSGGTVTFGGALATEASVSEDGRSLTVTVPPGVAGPAAVEVVNPGGLSASRLGAYRYLVEPTLTAVSASWAPFNSQTLITLTGQGLFGGTRVYFGPVPSPQVELVSSEQLRVRIPDGITGPVPLRVATPGPGTTELSATWPTPFTFTLEEKGSSSPGADAMARVGNTLLVARGGRLVVRALAVNESLYDVRDVLGVDGATALTVSGNEAFLVGPGRLVRYALENCASAESGACSPQELERVLLMPQDVSPTAVVASRDAAYVAIAGGGEVALLGRVDGQLQVVAQTSLAGGTLRGLERVRGALALLVEQGGVSRLELRDFTEGGLDLLGQLDNLPAPALSMAVEGNQILLGLGTGVRLVDATTPEEPVLVGRWDSQVPGNDALSVALAGP
ncbi:hypothetical protein D7X12_19415, partial [Corallococcus sicarius]